MTLYLDTSAIIGRYLAGAHNRFILDAIAIDTTWCTSAVTRTEALALSERICDIPGESDDLRRAILDDWESFHVVPVDQRCLDKAGEIARIHPVKMVEAIHLSAAARLPRPVKILTFDPNQIPTALAMGLDVVSA